MKRNLYRLVEVGVPITSPTHKAQLQQWLHLHVQDNTKMVTLGPELKNVHVPGDNTSPMRVHKAIYR